MYFAVMAVPRENIFYSKLQDSLLVLVELEVYSMELFLYFDYESFKIANFERNYTLFSIITIVCIQQELLTENLYNIILF